MFKTWLQCNYLTAQGLICLQLKQHVRATTAFARSISIVPTSAAYCGLGISFLERRAYKSAIDSFQAARMLDPKNDYNRDWLTWATHLYCDETAESGCRHCQLNQSAEKPSLQVLSLSKKQVKKMAKVLVVLEYAEPLRQVTESLERIGHLVFKANSFPEAMDFLKHSRVDLLIADVQLQDGGSIFDFLRWVMGDSYMKQVPFVCFATASAKMPKYQYDGLRTAARALGAAKYLSMEKFDSVAFGKEIDALLPRPNEKNGESDSAKTG